jgi:hypothetical protein
MSTPKTPSDPMTPEQRTAMAGELADLRLRVEHGLLKRLVVEIETGDVPHARDIAAAIGDLSPLLTLRSP